MKATSGPSLRIRSVFELMPVLALLVLAGCEKDTAQLVQDIDAAREGCTDEMLEASAEECVQMFEKYIEMGTGAIETYIGAVRAFDAAVDRGPAVRFDTAGLGHAISPELLDPANAREESAFPLTSPASTSEGASYSESFRSSRMPAPPQAGYRPDYVDGAGAGSRQPEAEIEPETGYPARRPPAPPQQQAPRRGAILPPEERLQRPWIGDAGRPEAYYPDADAPREELKRQTEEPKARRPQQSERLPL